MRPPVSAAGLLASLAPAHRFRCPTTFAQLPRLLLFSLVHARSTRKSADRIHILKCQIFRCDPIIFHPSMSDDTIELGFALHGQSQRRQSVRQNLGPIAYA